MVLYAAPPEYIMSSMASIRNLETEISSSDNDSF